MTCLKDQAVTVASGIKESQNCLVGRRPEVEDTGRHYTQFLKYISTEF